MNGTVMEAGGVQEPALPEDLARILNTSVTAHRHGHATAPRQTWQQFVSEGIAVVNHVGSPIRIENGRSDTTFAYLYALEVGRTRLMYDEGSVDLAIGQMVAFSGCRALTVVHEEDYSVTGLRVPVAGLRRLLPNWEAAEFVAFGPADADAAMLVALAKSVLQLGRAMTAGGIETMCDTITRLLAHCLSKVLLPDPCTDRAEYHRRRVKQYCRQHLASPDLSPQAICTAVGVSVAHLHRLFSGQQATLRSWIQGERLDAIRTVLCDPTSSTRGIGEIALSLGFKEVTHFSKAFRARFGMSPRQMRRAATRSSLAWTVA